MKDVTGSIVRYAEANGLSSIHWQSNEVPEGTERAFPYAVINVVGGTIDRSFRPAGGTVTPKFENSRVQIDLYWRWQGDMTPIQQLFQQMVYTFEDAQIPLEASAAWGGTRQFILMWRDGLERESVEDRQARISQDWLFTVQRGP